MTRDCEMARRFHAFLCEIGAAGEVFGLGLVDERLALSVLKFDLD
jgi:hypothetical protein